MQGWTQSLYRGFVAWVRRCLYLWVRTQVSGLEHLDGLPDGVPVCYALERKSLSSLAVLAEECARAGLPPPMVTLAGEDYAEYRSWFYLWPRHRLRGFPRKPLRNLYVARMLDRLATLDPDSDVRIVPVTIAWGRAPERPESFFRRITSDAWGISGRFRHLVMILVHGRQTVVQFAAPVSLRAYAGEGTEEHPEVALIAHLRRHFRNARTGIVGPDLSHRRTLFEAILTATDVRKAIETEAMSSGEPLVKAEKQAWKYIDEIASDFSWPVFQALYVIIEWFWTRLYKGIETHNVDRVKNLAGECAPVYVPCHRSHSDYLLSSFVLYNEGLQSPYKAAGINMNMPLIGPLLRRAGAFYLRRSFRDNPLYGAVFNEYVHQLFSRGFPVEYYVEGGRSRTGRTLPPRPGMLAMTVRSFLRDHDRPLAFIPIYAGYEKIIEEKTYLGELRGKAKKKENPLDVLRMVTNLRGQFGRVYLNVGEPIMLADFLDRVHPEWRNEDLAADDRPAWLNPAVNALAREVVTRINDAVVVNGINLAAVALLSKPRQAMEEDELLAHMSLYVRLLQQVGYGNSLVLPGRDSAELLRDVEALGLLERIEHPMGDIVRLAGDNAVLMTYYRNNVMHLFVMPALISSVFRLHHEVAEESVVTLCTVIYPYLRTELFMRWSEEEVPGEAQKWIAAFEAEGLLVRKGGLLCRPERGSRAAYRMSLFSGVVGETLQRFYVVIVLLQHAGAVGVTADGLVERCQLVAQRLSALYGFNAPEFFDKNLFRGFIDTLLELGVIRLGDNERLHFQQPAEVALKYANLVLDDDIRDNVERVARAHP